MPCHAGIHLVEVVGVGDALRDESQDVEKPTAQAHGDDR